MFARRPSGVGHSLRIAVALTVFSSTAAAATPVPELRFPSRSPRASLSQWIGLTHITVGYESPAVAGRNVWGAVVAPGVVWPIGDGEAATISFSRDVGLAGASVPAGTYALLAVPSAADWTLILNRRTRIWRAAERDPALDVARASVRVEAVPHRERLAFVFSDFDDRHATLDLEWEKRRVRIPIELGTDAQVASQLQSLEGGWRRYADAAWLALQKGTDLRAGLRYVDQSIALRETWFNTWIKASLLAAVGDYGRARQEAERALRFGRTAGDEFTSERRIEEALAEWPDRSSSPKASFEASRIGVVEDHHTASLAPLEERAVDAPKARATKPPSDKAFGPLIRRGLPDLRRCYERALRQDPSLVDARLTLSIAVGTSGRVANVTVDPPPPTGVLDACLKTAVGRWTFPASPTEYETQVPLVLSGRS